MSIDVKIDLGSLAQLTDTISRVPSAMSSHIVSAINTIANQTYATSKKTIMSQVNLGRDKVDQKMTIQLATEGYPTATITASGRGTILTNFGAKQLTRPTGNSRTGSKKAGVSVNIKPSGASGVIERGFFMRLKNTGQIGVFARDRTGKMVHRYGPSVDQVFNGVSKEMTPQVETDLRNEILSELDKITVTK